MHMGLQQLYSQLPKLGGNQDILQQVNKLWYIQTMEYYSALKRNELSSHENTCKKLKCILLSEKKKSQSEKATYCIIPTIWKRQNYEDSKKMSGYQGLGGGRDKQSTEYFQGSKIIYDTPLVGTYHNTFVKTHQMYKTNSYP